MQQSAEQVKCQRINSDQQMKQLKKMLHLPQLWKAHGLKAGITTRVPVLAVVDVSLAVVHLF